MSKLIIPLIFLLGSIAFALFFIVPDWKHFLALRGDSRSLQEMNAELDVLIEKRNVLVQKMTAITKDNLNRLDQIVPSVVQGPEVLLSLQQLAQAQGLRIEKLDLSGTFSTREKNIQRKTAHSGTVPSSAGIGTAQPAGVNTVNQSNSVSVGTNFNIEDSEQGLPAVHKADYQTIGVGMEVVGTYEAFKDFLRALESSIRITDVNSLTFLPVTNGFSFELSLKTYYQ